MFYEDYLRLEFKEQLESGGYELKNIPFYFMKCKNCPCMEECFESPDVSNCITVTEKHLKDKLVVKIKE